MSRQPDLDHLLYDLPLPEGFEWRLVRVAMDFGQSSWQVQIIRRGEIVTRSFFGKERRTPRTVVERWAEVRPADNVHAAVHAVAEAVRACFLNLRTMHALARVEP